MEDMLSSLNRAQLQAVRHPPDIPLQILAGPGSGKTKVLTTRIANLILVHGISPTAICAVTFTNKAANEMKSRLIKLIGEEKTVQVKLGTFHALCSVFLRLYAEKLGLEKNFTICDADESKKIIQDLLKKYDDGLGLTEGYVRSLISKAKSKSISAEQYAKAGAKLSLLTAEKHQAVAELYFAYEETLKRNNSLDFDDLLLYGLDLFKSYPSTVQWCKHVLVDEFQDTNAAQYGLMKAIAIAKCVTVVGDPDQSIYGWRSAEVENLAKMQKDFLHVAQIFLEQNYRSTGAIINASLAIVSQDKSRIAKSLLPSHPKGTPPVLHCCDSGTAEARFIAHEIRRLVAYTGKMIDYGDIAVLLRFNALSREIESALQKEGIPSRILGGHKFFERVEVKDLLAYLQLADNQSFTPAFIRAVNMPSRGIGEKRINEIHARATKRKCSPFEIVQEICDGKQPDLKPALKNKVHPFVKVIGRLQQLAAEGTSPADLLRTLIDLIKYKEHLEKTHKDWEARWENVEELISFAADVESNPRMEPPDPSSSFESDGSVANITSNGETPLRLFLQTSMLSSEGDNEKSEDDKQKVTITTCHSAKGLEWPVVFVPAVEQGVYPFYRSESTEEERRLLYVACTRAQGLLYLTHAGSRRHGGETKARTASEFVTPLGHRIPCVFSHELPSFDRNEVTTIASVLNRPAPDLQEVYRAVQLLRQSTGENATPFHAPPIARPISEPANYVLDPPRFETAKLQLSAAPQQHSFPVQPQLHMHMPVRKVLLPLPRANCPPVMSSAQIKYDAPVVVRPARPESRSPLPLVPPKPPPRTNCLAGTSRAQIKYEAPVIVQSARPESRPPLAVVPPNLPLCAPTTESTVPIIGVKRSRLGMGRSTTAYSNKKFKPPTA